MLEKVAVLGAGTMGHGIAQVAAQAGYETALFDVNEAALERGRAAIAANLNKGVEKGKITPQERETALGNLEITGSLQNAAADAALIIEAVPENMPLKIKIFGELDSCALPHAVLATNTSSLSVTEIAASVTHPERVVGMHFFNPPHILKLLEIVRAEQTNSEVIERAKIFGEKMDRALILVSDTPGFATSRLGLVLGLEAIRMLEQGVASAEDIDKGMELGYRHPMGPLKLTDLVGLDVRLSIAEYLYQELGGEQFRPPALLRRMVRAGKLGKKSGHGFYQWQSTD